MSLRIFILMIMLVEYGNSQSPNNDDQQLNELRSNDSQNQTKMISAMFADIEFKHFSAEIWGAIAVKENQEPSKVYKKRVYPNGRWHYDPDRAPNGQPIYRYLDYHRLTKYVLSYNTKPTDRAWIAYTIPQKDPFLICRKEKLWHCGANTWYYQERVVTKDGDRYGWSKWPDREGSVSFYGGKMMNNSLSECDNSDLYGQTLCVYNMNMNNGSMMNITEWILYDGKCTDNMPVYFYIDDEGNIYNLYYEEMITQWVMMNGMNETIAFCEQQNLMDCIYGSWFVNNTDDRSVVMNYNMSIIGGDECISDGSLPSAPSNQDTMLSVTGIIGVIFGSIISLILMIFMYYRCKSNITKTELKRLMNDNVHNTSKI